MINKILVFTVCFFASFSGISQQKMVAPPDTIPDPKEPENAVVCGLNHSIWLCGDRSGAMKVSFNNNSEFCCVGNVTKLYYTFITNQNLELNDSLGRSITYQTASDPAITNPISNSYKLFGPFEYNTPYTNLIEDGLAIPISSDSPGTTPKLIDGIIEANKVYVIEVTVSACIGYVDFNFDYGFGDKPTSFLSCDDYKIACENCLPKFQPVDDRYVVSAWVKESAGSTSGAINYTNSILKVTSDTFVYNFYPSGQIIDGWQRIEGVIQTNALGNLKIELLVSSGISYFDDIRVFPYDGSMITYVYDPITLRLMAELDERNYAKIYEYDEEGKLIRVKKETEKGMMTIQENRENSSTLD